MSNRQKTESELIFNALVGNNIKYLRKKHKLTQTDVGKAINVTFQQIGKYEQGKNGVHAFNLQKIAKNVFKVSMDVLVDPQMIAKHIGFSDYMNEVEDQQLTPQDAGYLKPQICIGSLEEIKDKLIKDGIDPEETILPTLRELKKKNHGVN